MAITFGSLFAGIGGIDLGFERAGMECKWQVEIDDYANQVLEKHWPDVRRHRDIRTFPPEPIDEWRVDLICGGFPCQDISYAGKGAGLAGERSGLFYEAMRVVRLLGPRFVVLENVAALRSRGLDQVLGTLASLGFDAEWHCIPAAAIGAPHIRDRAFVLAYAANKRSKVGHFECAKPHRQKETDHAVPCSLDVADSVSEGLEVESCEPSNNGSQQQTAERGSGRWDWWATEPDVGRVANGVPKRVDRLKCLGNAVVPQVAEWIGRQICDPTSETH